MNTNLFDLIALSRKGDDESILLLIDKFKPLINKFVRSLDYDEDSRQDLIIGMIASFILCLYLSISIYILIKVIPIYALFLIRYSLSRFIFH